MVKKKRTEKKIKTLRDIPSALEEAIEVYETQVQIPKHYLLALQGTQIFEQTLRIILLGFITKAKTTLNKEGQYYEPKIDKGLTYKYLIKRIKNFLPESENKEFYEKIRVASTKRNDFIHESFKLKDGSKLVNLDMDNYYIHKDAMEVMFKWMEAYKEAIGQMTNIIDKHLKGIKIKVS